MFVSRRGYNWNDGLSSNWWAYDRVGLCAGLITGTLRYVFSMYFLFSLSFSSNRKAPAKEETLLRKHL